MSDSVVLMRPEPLAFTGCAPNVMPAWSWMGISQTPLAFYNDATLRDPEFCRLANMSSLDDPEDDFPTRAPMPDNQDEHDPRNAMTTPAPPTDRDAPTNPEASLGPILPPAPPTLEDSYLERAIRVVASAGARMAEDREERRQQHAELVSKLDEQGTKQDDAARLVLELGANLEILSSQFRLFRDACEARLAEGDARFKLLEDSIEALKIEMRRDAEKRLVDAERITKLTQQLEDLKRDVAARQAPAAAT